MKTHLCVLLPALLLAATAHAQTPAPTSGKITYETMRRFDPSQVRMVINGQEVKPGDPLPNGAAPPDMPDVITSSQRLFFAGTSGKEEQDRPGGMMRRMMGGPDGGGGRPDGPGSGRGQTMRMEPPIRSVKYLDLATKKLIEVLEVKKDSLTKEYYRAESALATTATDWKEADKTRKVAGYTCHKATATRKGQPYTIWYTTELPFTYSPVAELTPAQGVVLQIESDDESYKAQQVESMAVATADVTPPANTQLVPKEQLETIRRKAMADFRQKMMSSMPFSRN